MALTVTLEGIRSRIVKTLYGRRLGLLPGPGPAGSTSADAYQLLGGPAAFVNPVDTITSATTASTIIPPYGITVGRTTDSSGTTSGWNVDSPIPGVRKSLVCGTTGYAVFLLNGTANTIGVTGYKGGPFNAAGLSTATQITLWGPGAAVEMIGLSTSKWIIYPGSESSLTTFGTSAI